MAQTLKRLPSAQVVQTGSWDRAPHRAPSSPGSLLLPLPQLFSLLLLSLSLYAKYINKYINKQTNKQSLNKIKFQDLGSQDDEKQKFRGIDTLFPTLSVGPYGIPDKVLPKRL